MACPVDFKVKVDIPLRKGLESFSYSALSVTKSYVLSSYYYYACMVYEKKNFCWAFYLLGFFTFFTVY